MKPEAYTIPRWNILARAFSIITGTKRYIPNFEWSKKSWVHNTFRIYELTFGRKEGIRLEVRSYADTKGNQWEVGFTFEGKCAVLETKVRKLLNKLASVKVVSLKTATPISSLGLLGNFMFAIAFDSATGGNTGSGTTLDFSHTCTGSNLLIWHSPYLGGSAGDTLNSDTYNSVSLTNACKVADQTGGYLYLEYLINPSTGSNTSHVGKSSAANYISCSASSYSGCKQSGQPDATNTGQVTVVANSITVSVTTVADNCWTVSVCQDGNYVLVADTGVTARNTPAGGGEKIGDSNGAITPAGSTSMKWNLGGGGLNLDKINMCMASFSPAPVTANSNFLIFM